MRFTTPLALLLLGLLPLIWYIGFPRLAYRRRRDWVSLILRTIIMVLVVLALAGLQSVRIVDRLAVVFIVDASDSMDEAAKQAQLAYIQAAIAEKPVEDEWAVVLFGADAKIERSLNATFVMDEFATEVNPTQTDIAKAMDTANSLFPADTARRIIILGDGQETQGNAVSRAQFMAASGVEVSYVPIFREPSPDVRVVELDAPNKVGENQEFDISVAIESEIATEARLRIFSRGAIIHEETLTLQEGITRYALTRTSEQAGFLDFTAQVEVGTASDRFIQNNQLSTFSQVVGPPRVLVIADDLNEITNLSPALEEAGVVVDVVQAQNFTSNVAAIAGYESIVIVNVPATALSNTHMETLERYTRDLGGGVIVVGGPDSYGPGGYFQTPFERFLPVEMQLRDQQRLPQITIAYLIDRSGSMAATLSSGVPNIELAKEAIIRSVEFLQPTDRAGIVTFDSGGTWLAEFAPVFDRRLLQQFVAQLRPGGGTDILAGLRLVADDIVTEESERKHIILLTDGGSTPSGLVDLTQELHDDHDVTLSVIAIGSGNANFLEEMAVVGDGNYHVVSDVTQIPTIFAQETVLAARSFIIEEDFSPTRTRSHPIISGLDGFPQLHGYVATTPKDTAQVILTGTPPFNDPILVAWQYGLGRVIAFTSDVSGRWASDWVPWDGYSQFWEQAITWTITEGASDDVETQIIMRDGEAWIQVDTRDATGNFVNNLAMEATVLSPDQSTTSMTLPQVAPGLYTAPFVPEAEGAYFVGLQGNGTVGESVYQVDEVSGWVMSYSPEYRQVPPDESLLIALADATDGQTLTTDDVSSAFAHTAEPQSTSAPIWQYLLLLAALLLPLDIAVRRLIVTRSDLQRLREFVLNRGESSRSEQMSTLLGARERARQRTTTGEPHTVTRLRQSRDDTPNPAPGEPEPQQLPPSPPAPATPTSQGEGSSVSRLLKSRQQRQIQPDDEG